MYRGENYHVRNDVSKGSYLICKFEMMVEIKIKNSEMLERLYFELKTTVTN